MKRLFQSKKNLYLILAVIIVSIFTLSVAYAVLSTTLNIMGSTEISSSSWDIYLANVEVKNGSVSAESPQITGNDSLSFNANLTLPGDFYEFTVDVVNDGSIDAMIDSVVKTPELTTDQTKYIKYEITYENGDSINEKQTLKKETTTPIKVRIEYRKDLSASDLPTTTTELSLGLTLVYVQSDGSGSEISNNGKTIRVVSGDGTQLGDELCVREECFYVISSTESTVTMLSKYNLHVGNSIDENENAIPLENPTGKQDVTAVGYNYDMENDVEGFPYIGCTPFSLTNQYYNGSIVESYVNDYSGYLTTQGLTPVEARLLRDDDLKVLNCNFNSMSNLYSCIGAPSWLFSTSYWIDAWRELPNTGGGIGSYAVMKERSIEPHNHLSDGTLFGVRPVITISRSLL